MQCEVCEFKTQCAAGKTEQKALRQKLANQPRASCPQRRTQCHLTAPAIPTRKQQPRDVSARNEPYRKDSNIERDNGWPRGPGHNSLVGPHTNTQRCPL